MRRLPKTAASPRFTHDVLTAVRDERPRPFLFRLAATAATLLIAAGVYTANVERGRRAQSEALREEHRRIESALEQVKRTAAETEPLVVLENGDTKVIIENKSEPVYY